MKIKAKNLINILIIIVMCVCLALTGYYSSNNKINDKQMPQMNNETPPEKPEGDNNMQEPPEKPDEETKK